jgi:hypothetical protein
MNQAPIESLVPGTVLKVQSTRFSAVMHWGVVGYGKDISGYPLIWHSQKSDTLRCTEFLEFSAGQVCEIVWVPVNAWQASNVITRLQSKEGLPWHLTKANCEMVVRWAVEDRAVSDQLAVGSLAVVAVVVLAALSAG